MRSCEVAVRERAADRDLGEPCEPPRTIGDVAGHPEIEAMEIVGSVELIGRCDGASREKDRRDAVVDRETVMQTQVAIPDERADAAERAAPAELPSVRHACAKQARRLVDRYRSAVRARKCDQARALHA